MATTPTAQDAINRVAADRHAEDRLHDYPVEIHDGENGVIATVDEPRLSIAACARSDVQQGELHEAFAAMFLQLVLATDWQTNDGGDAR